MVLLFNLWLESILPFTFDGMMANHLIIVLWKVLETGDDLGEVTETVDYFVQASTIAAGNLFGRYTTANISVIYINYVNSSLALSAVEQIDFASVL